MTAPTMPDKYAHVDLVAAGINLKPGEPWFLLRGQDSQTPDAIVAYVGLLRNAAMALPSNDEGDERAGALLAAADDIEQHAEAIREWQRQNPQYVKLPD